jgi:hypothetical protein
VHPILSRRGRLLPYLAACAPMAAILTALFARPGGLFLGEAVALAVPLTLAFAFIGLSTWYPCRQYRLGRSKLTAGIATFAVGALLASSVWVLLGACASTFSLGSSPSVRGATSRCSPTAGACRSAGRGTRG